MAGIFISYRRDDSAGQAGRLFDQLCAHFGAENVFMDVDTIRPGEDFARIIEERIARCDVMLALIGRDWLGLQDSNGKRRLDDPEDFVRLEIGAALSRGLVVVPVLVEGASMPPTAQLPNVLARLARLQAFTLSDARFHQDSENLIAAIETYIQTPVANATGARKIRRPWATGIAATMLGLGLLLGLLWGNHPGFLRHSASRAMDLSGRWVAQVPSAQGKAFQITLDLQMANGQILGRVQYPAGSGAVTDGHLERNQISFRTVHQPQFSEREVTTRFEGQIQGDELELVMQYDDVAKRIRARRG